MKIILAIFIIALFPMGCENIEDDNMEDNRREKLVYAFSQGAADCYEAQIEDVKRMKKGEWDGLEDFKAHIINLRKKWIDSPEFEAYSKGLYNAIDCRQEMYKESISDLQLYRIKLQNCIDEKVITYSIFIRDASEEIIEKQYSFYRLQQTVESMNKK